MPMVQHVPLGELLVAANLLTRSQLAEALVEQQSVSLRLGSLLVNSGVVLESNIVQILARQLSVPWVSLRHISVTRSLLNLISRDVVKEHCLLPVYLRSGRSSSDILYICMDDPTDERAMRAASRDCGLPVRPLLACPSAIVDAVRTYYKIDVAPQLGARGLPTTSRVA